MTTVIYCNTRTLMFHLRPPFFHLQIFPILLTSGDFLLAYLQSHNGILIAISALIKLFAMLATLTNALFILFVSYFIHLYSEKRYPLEILTIDVFHYRFSFKIVFNLNIFSVTIYLMPSSCISY